MFAALNIITLDVTTVLSIVYPFDDWKRGKEKLKGVSVGAEQGDFYTPNFLP